MFLFSINARQQQKLPHGRMAFLHIIIIIWFYIVINCTTPKMRELETKEEEEERNAKKFLIYNSCAFIALA